MGNGRRVNRSRIARRRCEPAFGRSLLPPPHPAFGHLLREHPQVGKGRVDRRFELQALLFSLTVGRSSLFDGCIDASCVVITIGGGHGH